MEWQWKGTTYPLLKKEYEQIKKQLMYEQEKGGPMNEEKFKNDL